MRLSLLCFLSCSLFHSVTHGLKFKVEGHYRRSSDGDALARRGNVDGSTSLTNEADLSYYANVTINGQSFAALIDTGSGDLWVAGNVPKSKDTGKKATVTYAVGTVQGQIKTGEVQFAGFKVPNQAYLEVPADNSTKKHTGLIGLGPHDNSNIYNTLKTNDGVPLLDTIFMQNTSTPNYLTVNLGRLEDPTDIFSGDISIGEILPTPPSFAAQGIHLENITSQPKLPVNILPVRKKTDQHFQILLDEDGIVGPDGHPIPFCTTVSGQKNTKQAVAVVDTGFSLTQVPRSVADAFYSRHDGAEFTNVTGIGGTWIMPCNQEVNLTFSVGGQKFPIHPLDATLNPKILGISSLKNSKGEDACVGMFQPFTFDLGKEPTYDIILGMSFIRNAYVLFDFGDFVAKSNGNSTKRGDPYLRMLSTINPVEAHSDFVMLRLDGVDTTDRQYLGPGHKSGDDDHEEKKKSNRTMLFVGLSIGAGVLGVAAFAAAFFFYRRKKNPSRSAPGGNTFSGGTTAYSKLQDDHHIDMQHTSYTGQSDQLYGNSGMGGLQSQQLYDGPSHSTKEEYPNPWDSRH
ncbi:hypothetical protein PM082_017062 [Marasmius tenuissimus]|nr:hypothetical protein PM082_017062 [Marasmius tenuissimus]